MSTTHLTMNTVVHAAFRRDLGRFDRALAHFPAGSASRAAQLNTAWEFLAEELHHHHEYEEIYFWPALQEAGADVSSVSELDGEHAAMRTALDAATVAMAALAQDPSAQHAASARAAAQELTEVLVTHLSHEERDLEPISAAYASSKPMKVALSRVKRAHMKNMGDLVNWLQDGATDDDRLGLRDEIPAPVVWAFATLGGRRYRRVIAPTWH